MNWEMLAAIGQLAAVCVGIPSLIYLAVQIREQTKERRHAAVNALTSHWGDLTKSFHDNADFCAIYLRGVQSFNDLDAVSKLRFSSFLNRFFKNFQAMYFSHRDGVLNASLWGEVERTMSDVIAYPGYANGGRHEDIGIRKSLAVSLMQLSPGATSRRPIRPII